MEIKINEGNDLDNHLLLCPLCGFEYTHLELIQVAARGEDGESNEIDIDAVSGTVMEAGPYPAPVGDKVGIGRRHRISISGECEGCGGKFALVFTQHKGYTYAEVVKL